MGGLYHIQHILECCVSQEIVSIWKVSHSPVRHMHCWPIRIHVYYNTGMHVLYKLTHPPHACRFYAIVCLVVPTVLCCFPFIGHSYGPAGLWWWVCSCVYMHAGPWNMHVCSYINVLTNDSQPLLFPAGLARTEITKCTVLALHYSLSCNVIQAYSYIASYHP